MFVMKFINLFQSKLHLTELSLYVSLYALQQIHTVQSQQWTCEIWSKVTRETRERRHCRRSGVFFVNFKCMTLIYLFLMKNLSRFLFVDYCFSFSSLKQWLEWLSHKKGLVNVIDRPVKCHEICLSPSHSKSRQHVATLKYHTNF